MSKEGPLPPHILKAAREVFNYSCAQLFEAKTDGREEDRRNFYNLARALEAAFRTVPFLESPASTEGGSDSGETDPGSDDRSVH